ncbi:MAG: hypothetical protein E7645_06445 [Ruminococcaceae bacterium]|nr:hypothetical protein [Oscillospiraceae bacterium]
MTVILIIGQVFLSVLAIFGLMFLFRAMMAWYFMPEVVTVAVIVKTRKELQNLDILLCEAEKNAFRRRGTPVAVMIPSHLMQKGSDSGGEPDLAYLDTIRDYGAVVYIMTEQNQPSSV